MNSQAHAGGLLQCLAVYTVVILEIATLIAIFLNHFPLPISEEGFYDRVTLYKMICMGLYGFSTWPSTFTPRPFIITRSSSKCNWKELSPSSKISKSKVCESAQ